MKKSTLAKHSFVAIVFGLACKTAEVSQGSSTGTTLTALAAVQPESSPAPAGSSSGSPESPAAGAQVDQPRKPDVIYVPTPQPVVDKMLEIAGVKASDLVYDLGCGDGRIVVTAAKRHGARAVGFDIDPERVAEARENVRRNGVEDLVRIEQRDIFTLDLAPANVVTLYLLPSLNVKLIPQLSRMRAGSRVVSHDFDMQGVTPDQQLELQPDPNSIQHSIFLYRVPLKKEH